MKKIVKISLFVLTQLTNVTETYTDRQTDGQTPHDGIGRVYASHGAAKMVQFQDNRACLSLMIIGDVFGIFVAS